MHAARYFASSTGVMTRSLWRSPDSILTTGATSITFHSTDFEGATHVDALLLNATNGFAVLVEAKVLSDVSFQVSFDVARNQLARNIDVMLEQNPLLEPPLRHRDPEKSLFVFQSPAMFKENPHVRQYGWLLQDYKKS